MKQTIVITGASSGFGELTVHRLAKAGHIVYPSMRETDGRNAPQVEAAKRFTAENELDLHTLELHVSSPDDLLLIALFEILHIRDQRLQVIRRKIDRRHAAGVHFRGGMFKQFG